MTAISKPLVKELRGLVHAVFDWMETGGRLQDYVPNRFSVREMRDELDRLVVPKRSVKAAHGRAKTKHDQKARETQNLRAIVFARAGGRCEVVYSETGRCFGIPSDFAHLFGKKHVRQSPTNCVAACFSCHRLVLTLNKGGGARCWEIAARTFELLGFKAEAALAWDKAFKAGVKASLPAAPRTHA